MMAVEEGVHDLPVPGRDGPPPGGSHRELDRHSHLLVHLELSVLVKGKIHLLLLTNVIEKNSLQDYLSCSILYSINFPC